MSAGVNFWRERHIPLISLAPSCGDRTDSFEFEVAPGEMQYPQVYEGRSFFGAPERFGFAVKPDLLPPEIQAIAHVRPKSGLVNFGTRKRIEIECHDVTGLIFLLQRAEALNKPRDSIFRDNGCTITAHAVYVTLNRYPFFRGWIMAPEKIVIASW